MTNHPNNNAPLWLKNVGYFKGAYLGDLIVFRNTIYYVPHTNVEARKNEIREKTGHLSVHFGLFGILIDLAIAATINATDKSNPSRLNVALVVAGTNSAEQIRQRLDAFVAEARREAIQTTEFGLIKPLRFSTENVKNVKIGLNKLRFDSEFDDHDFKIGFTKKKQLRDVLWMNGFLKT